MAWRNGIQNGFYVGPPGDPDGWLADAAAEDVKDEWEAAGPPEGAEISEEEDFSEEADLQETAAEEEETFESRIAGEISWSNGVCPYCGGLMRPGFYRAAYASGRVVTHQFVPEEEDITVSTPDFLIYSRLPLRNEGTGFYCEDCGKAFVEFSAPDAQA